MIRMMSNEVVFNLISGLTVDQTPMLFVVDTKRTYEQIREKHIHKIWIPQPGSGLDKRQCTVQVMTRVGHFSRSGEERTS